MELIGLYLVACTLLVGAGVAKLLRPGDTARAISATVPLNAVSASRLVRIGALSETVLGIGALLAPRSVTAWLVALSFALFAGFVAYARVHGGPVASCGCFGTPDTPATWTHVVVNTVLACSTAAVAAAGPSGTLLRILGQQPAHGMPLVVVSALCAWLSYLAISLLAQLEAARRLTAVSFERDGAA